MKDREEEMKRGRKLEEVNAGFVYGNEETKVEEGDDRSKGEWDDGLEEMDDGTERDDLEKPERLAVEEETEQDKWVNDAMSREDYVKKILGRRGELDEWVMMVVRA